MTLLITESDVRKMLCVKDAIPIIEESFRLAGQGQTENPPRFRMPFEKGFLQFGPAALPSQKVMGFKMWANFGTPLTGTLNFLYSMETGELLAIIQAHQIGTYRTSATSGIAAKYLSRPDAAVVGMYGAGRQAAAQLEAICAVRPIRRAVVYSRRAEPLKEFCRKTSEQLKIEVVPAASPEAVPKGADIVVTITSSDKPILFGDWLTGPCLVIAAGANHWYEREIDEKLIKRAALVVVDEKEHSKVESGDLLWPIGRGLLSWNNVQELGGVVTGRVTMPPLDSSIVLFESHGLAIEDVAISAVAYERAKAMNLGRPIDLWPKDS
jgi:ornithine cyclodeaminase/alanine dehydrogenase-like protein (mu-crystallin family)